jgi:hypothetical protein
LIGGTVTYPNTSGGVQLPVICDDFNNESYNPEDWTAFVTTLSNLTVGTYGTPESQLKYGDTTNGGSNNSVVVNDKTQANLSLIGESGSAVDTNLTQLQAYDVAALLAIDIAGITDNSPNANELAEYSYAMWTLFDTTDALNQLGNGTGSGTETAVEQQAIVDLKTAIGDVCASVSTTGATCTTNSIGLSALLSGWNVTIYSYDTAAGATCYDGSCANPPSAPQEFLTATAVPEAPSLAVLAVYGVFGAASLLFFGRRRILKCR